MIHRVYWQFCIEIVNFVSQFLKVIFLHKSIFHFVLETKFLIRPKIHCQKIERPCVFSSFPDKRDARILDTKCTIGHRINYITPFIQLSPPLVVQGSWRGVNQSAPHHAKIRHELRPAQKTCFLTRTIDNTQNKPVLLTFWSISVQMRAWAAGRQY